jgi:hypothetical protein
MSGTKIPVVALGGDFPTIEGPGSPETLDQETLMANHQRFVGVTHGKWSLSEDLKPIVSKYIHALLYVQGSADANLQYLEDLRNDLPEEKRRRVFGLVGGWYNLSPERWQAILAFLRSESDLPDDPNVQTLLGLDAPVLRLALRVALEVIRHEITAKLEDGASTQDERADVVLAVLLQPAIDLAGAVPGQADTAKSLMEFLANYSLKSLRESLANPKDQSVLKKTVDDALDRLTAEVTAQMAKVAGQIGEVTAQT